MVRHNGSTEQLMPGRVRLLAVIDDLDVGGTLEVVLSQLTALDPERFEVGLLTLSDDVERIADRDLPEHLEVLGVPYRHDFGYGVVDYLRDGFFLRSAKAAGEPALRAISAFRPDILHFNTHPRNLGLGILAARSAALTLVFTDHVVRIRESDYSARARALLRMAYRRLYRPYHVVCVGPNVEAVNRASGFLAADRRHLLLENQIDIQRFHPPHDDDREARDGNTPTVINVARILPVKAPDVLIEAFGRLGDVGAARLALVGPDGMDGAMQKLAADRVHAPRAVDFPGARKDVPDLLRAAAIGAMPSRREGLPLALLEMMASGLPVVVSDIPELTLVVTDEHDGLVVPVDDPDALATALTRLLNEPALRQRLGDEARRTAERRMSVDSVSVLETFYEEALSHG